MNEKKITTARGNVYYWISEGRKDNCIVFCHGLTADHTLFDMQIEEWSKDYTVITWDMPLHGKSKEYDDFSIVNATKDLRQILQTEQIDQIVIVGQSAGGFIAQAFIQQYPAMVSAFIGIDTTPLGMSYYKKSELFWIKHYADIAKWYPYEMYCKLGAKSVSVTKESYQSFYDCLKGLGKKGMLKAADLLYKDFLNCKEVDMKCPVLLLLGEYDRTGYVKRYNEMWEKRTGFPLKIIPNASHNSNFDNYVFFNEIVMVFLDKNTRGN